jgi:YcaO-like protein with predicted kinase domain
MSAPAKVEALLAEHVESAESASQISDGRSDVYELTGGSGRSYTVKLYPHAPAGGAIGALEAVAYQRLSGSSAVRHCYASGADFIITDYIEGTPLADAVLADAVDMSAATDQLLSYLRACFAVAVQGYGEPDAMLRGSHQSFSDFLRAYLERVQGRIDDLPTRLSRELHPHLSALVESLDSRTDELDGVVPRFVPVDLNLANFLVTSTGRLVVLDLKTFWLADPLLALGEWTAHTYGSPAHAAMLARWGPLSPQELRRVRFYALLATLDVELFVAEASGDPQTVAPWGNVAPLGHLAAVHAQFLSADAPLADVLLTAVPQLGSGWSAKPRGGGRWEPPERTAQRLETVRGRAGITRVAEITNLDRTGVHVFQATRPDAEAATDTFTVFSGRGATAMHARVAAIAEGIERFCGERAQFDPTRIVTGTFEDAEKAHPVVGLEQFNLPADRDYDATTRLEWVPGTDLFTGAQVLVPACAVFYPYSAPAGVAAPMRYFTTGFGAGNTLLEAVTHGLAEVIERDAAALNRILRNNPAVPIASIDSAAARTQVAVLLDAGLKVVVRSITTRDVDIPSFSVICEETSEQDSMYLSGGYGSHPDKEIALVRAVQEAAASRVGTISGAREDLTKFRARAEDSRTLHDKFSYWFDTDFAVEYGDLPSYPEPTLLDDLARMSSAVDGAGLSCVLFVDLSHPELQLFVVKVLVPRVERYSFRMTCVGERARRMYREQHGRELPLPPIHEGLASRPQRAG